MSSLSANTDTHNNVGASILAAGSGEDGHGVFEQLLDGWLIGLNWTNGACRSTNSKLVLQKVKGQTVQGQMAQEF